MQIVLLNKITLDITETRNAERESRKRAERSWGNRKVKGKQHREWVIKLLIGLGLRLRLAPIFHPPISVFVLCSLFLVG